MTTSPTSPTNPQSPRTREWVPAGGKLLRMNEVDFKEMQWLWHPYLPMGSASMLFGPGGLGKSHIACDIAARISAGVALPGQAVNPKPRVVLIMTAEDDPEAVLQPRLVKAGALMSNIRVPEQPFVLDANGLRSMEAHMREAAATVIFIDPMVSYMGGKIDMNKMNEVRTITGALHTTAMKTSTAIILVHHSRKGKGGEDYEKAAGSADFNNAVRSVLFVSRNDAGQCLMSHVKSNYSSLGPSIPYEIDEAADIVTWHEPTSAPGAHGGGRRRMETQTWIREFLVAGPQSAKTVEAAALEAGLNKSTLNRAKDGVAESFIVKTNNVNVWWWRLL